MILYGPLARVLDPTAQDNVEDIKRQIDAVRSTTANADLLFRRLLVADNDELVLAHLRAVAGASRQVPAALLQSLHRRRAAAARILAAHAQSVVSAVLITPQWRVAVGHGETSASETSLTLSPTHGLPILPGSTLKGLSVAQARAENELTEQRLRTVFGSPRPSDEQREPRQGSVVFFDAVPADTPEIVVDTLTPHVMPYYEGGNRTGVPASPPAEYHNPVPVRFLALGRVGLRTLLVGPAEDVSVASGMLCRGLDDRGIGGKTSAGYGYCDTEIETTQNESTPVGNRLQEVPG